MPLISVIIPTYNEAKNALVLIRQIEECFEKATMNDYEILVMDDDSPDHTADLVNGLGREKARAVNRRGKPRGLSAAVIDGFAHAQGDILAVMDADLSHSPAVLPALVLSVQSGANLAVGSRYVNGGGVVNWPWKRRFVSRVSCLLARPVTRVKDATSGFFALRREVMQGVELSPRGFKIGLEIYVKGRHGGKIVEVPYIFTDRREGESKLSRKVMGLYLQQLWNLMALRNHKKV